MRIRGLMLLVVLAAAGISIAAASDDQMIADQMFDGMHIYNRSCSGCHGASGQGVTLFGPPLVGDTFLKTGGNQAIGYVIDMGRKYRDKMYPAYSGMPKFQFIRGGELQALIDYLKGPLQAPSQKAAPEK